ncbi:hypothetical protein EVAR_43120_1 [Eumeta japonica]|uniref:Uncharacterized protein n=1 Tax=Eumeta variegata TaxID=151549 RepID=A0A4C1XPN8_EUMVA|nr:hypothetical protein EVAR_43120_1 [Eumeta japonica]
MKGSCRMARNRHIIAAEEYKAWVPPGGYQRVIILIRFYEISVRYKICKVQRMYNCKRHQPKRKSIEEGDIHQRQILKRSLNKILKCRIAAQRYIELYKGRV